MRLAPPVGRKPAATCWSPTISRVAAAGSRSATRRYSTAIFWFDLEAISPASSGRLDDGLQEGIEEIGSIQVGDGRSTPLRLVRVSDDQGTRWTFARGTVQQTDGWFDTLEARWIIDWLARSQLDGLLQTGPFDIMWWQWLALLVPPSSPGSADAFSAA